MSMDMFTQEQNKNRFLFNGTTFCLNEQIESKCSRLLQSFALYGHMYVKCCKTTWGIGIYVLHMFILIMC